MSVIDPTTTAPPERSLLDQSPMQRATSWAHEQLARLQAGTERALLDRAAALSSQPRNGEAGIGEPIVNDYVAFDVACTSPIQFESLPPYRPDKIIAAGEDAFIVAFLFVNPAVSVPDGFAVPPAVQLAGRDFRVKLDEMNISDVVVGTNCVNPLQPGTFTSPANTLSAFVFQLSPGDPGPNPKLFEANILVDVDGFVQPYSAFATTFFDVDDDPGFLFVPPNPPGFRHEIPNRYMIYRK